MPHYRFDDHGALASYLEQYPGLFGLYRNPAPSLVPGMPRPQSSKASAMPPVPRGFSKARRDAGARYRDVGIIWIDGAGESLSPLEAEPSPPSRRDISPFGVAGWEEGASPGRAPAVPLPAAVPLPVPVAEPYAEPRAARSKKHPLSFAERVRRLQEQEQEQAQRDRERQQQRQRKRHQADDRSPDAYPARSRQRTQYAADPLGSQYRRAQPPYEASAPHQRQQHPQQDARAPDSRLRRSRRRTQHAANPTTYSYPQDQPAFVQPVEFADSVPLPPARAHSHRVHHAPTPPRHPTPPPRAAFPVPPAVPAPQAPPLYRRGAVRRSSRFRMAVPMTQTDPAMPLPELSRLDRLLENLSTLVRSSSLHLAPSHAHMHANAVPELPRALATKLASLHAYLALAPSALLPDQDSAAARWASPFRLFAHIRARDALAEFDGLALHPPLSARGQDPMAGHWRVLQREGRSADTWARRHYLPGLFGLLGALELVRHLKVCVDRRAVETGVQLGDGSLPRPLAARMRKLDRLQTTLRWQVALVGEALWGGPDGPGNVGGRIRHCREELQREGFLKVYADGLQAVHAQQPQPQEPARDKGRKRVSSPRKDDRERERKRERRR